MFIIDVLAVSSYHQLIILYLKIVMASSDVLKSDIFPATNHTLLKRGVNFRPTSRLEIWFLVPQFRGIHWWGGSCALPDLIPWAVFLKKNETKMLQRHWHLWEMLNLTKTKKSGKIRNPEKIKIPLMKSNFSPGFVMAWESTSNSTVK